MFLQFNIDICVANDNIVTCNISKIDDLRDSRGPTSRTLTLTLVKT